MHACLDDLVTALYVTIDDLLGPRLGPGRPPRLSDAELVCLAVAQVLLGARSERHWLRLSVTGSGICFLLARPARLQQAPAGGRTAPQPGIRHMARVSPSWWDRFRLLDATPLPGGASRETVKGSALWPHAAYGDDRATAAGNGACRRCCAPPTPCRSPGAWPPPAGRARSPRRTPPASRRWRRARSSWPTRAWPAGRSTSTSVPWVPTWSAPTAPTSRTGSSLGVMRQWIESIISTLKEQLGLDQHRGRTLGGVFVRAAQRVLALAAAVWLNWQLDGPSKRSLLPR